MIDIRIYSFFISSFDRPVISVINSVSPLAAVDLKAILALRSLLLALRSSLIALPVLAWARYLVIYYRLLGSTGHRYVFIFMYRGPVLTNQ